MNLSAPRFEVWQFWGETYCKNCPHPAKTQKFAFDLALWGKQQHHSSTFWFKQWYFYTLLGYQVRSCSNTKKHAYTCFYTLYVMLSLVLRNCLNLWIFHPHICQFFQLCRIRLVCRVNCFTGGVKSQLPAWLLKQLTGKLISDCCRKWMNHYQYVFMYSWNLQILTHYSSSLVFTDIAKKTQVGHCLLFTKGTPAQS